MGGVPSAVKFSPGAYHTSVRSLRRYAGEGTVSAASSKTVRSMIALLWLIDTVIGIYIWLLIAQAVLSWLVAFGIVNRHNRIVGTIEDFLWRITEPLLRPIRRVLPNLGGIDISPVILILLLVFLRRLLDYDIAPSIL
jgi:YggT family protein